MRQDKEIIEQQARDLLRLIETRSHFFANISHEFRTPLTVILGMATELQRANAPEWNRKFGRATDLIERNGKSLLRLINQILDLSKLEAGEMQLRPVRADLAGFARYVGESFQSLANVQGIQLHILLEEETGEVDFDRDKLGDILSNLLTNALKFTPEGGHIYYQLKRLDSWQPLAAQGFYEELTPTPRLEGPGLDGPGLDGPWIQFSVSDTGPGIEPASLPKIFGRFYQVNNQADPPVSGTGIGLSLVRELVLLMQGGLAVRNRADLDVAG